MGSNLVDVLRESASFGAGSTVTVAEDCSSRKRNVVQQRPDVKIRTGNDREIAFNGGRDFATFVSLLRSYGKNKALSDGRKLHNRIRSRGFEGNTYLGNCLLQMYGNCGCAEDATAAFHKIRKPNLYSWNILLAAYAQNRELDNARNLFDQMPERDVVSWSTMMGACAENGHDHEALFLFNHMQLEGIEPDKISFICVVDACARLASIYDGQKLHAAIIGCGFEHDVVVGTALVSMYGKCGSLSNARNVFGKMPHRNVISWNAMIGSCAQSGHGKEALDIFHRLEVEDLKPDAVTFICALDACASHGTLQQGLEIHAAIHESGYEQDVAVGTALINMYGKCRSLDDAQNVFNRMHQRNVVSWSAMIAVLAQNDHCKESLELFRQMQIEQVKPNSITFMCVLDACGSLATLEEGHEIHAAILHGGYDHHVIKNALVSMYGKCGGVEDARSLFGRMTKWDVVSWSAIMTACMQNEQNKEALELFKQMQVEGIEADKIIFTCVLDACATLSALEEGKDIHATLVDKGCERLASVGTALINLYGKCGCLDQARTVFDRMPLQDVSAWGALIGASAHSGHGKEALKFFRRMQHEGVKPDSAIFISVLNACSHTGCVNDGRHYFMSMARDHGITHTMDHYLCLIDLLGRAGLLDEAEELILQMPLKLVEMAWFTLLGACRIHCDKERGIRVANQCFRLNPKNAAPYIILSNIYAEAGDWDGVDQVQGSLKEMGLKTHLGRSFIEVNKIVHE